MHAVGLHSWGQRRFGALALATSLSLGLAGGAARAAEIDFDLPESIECRDVTPPDFAGREYLKVIEGRMRISARLTSGAENEIVDFIYTISSPDRKIRFQDYLPNTTLESAVANDRVEIKDASENAQATGADVHVVYKLLSLGVSHNQSAKQSESSQYIQIAPKELVVAAGTIEREHGVFFKLRPSRDASLEGGKDFTFLATVPRGWRGDLCTVSCAARTRKHSFFGSEVLPAGRQEAQIGLHLAGDMEAAGLAEQLRLALDERQAAEALQTAPKQSDVFHTISTQAGSLFGHKKPDDSAQRKQLEQARQQVADAQERLRQLAN